MTFIEVYSVPLQAVAFFGAWACAMITGVMFKAAL